MKPKPRRFVRMFKPQFADLVRYGLKLQTVRPTPKRMPKPGDTLDARQWSGKPYRSKQTKIGEFEIVSVETFRLCIEEDCVEMRIGPARLNGFERSDFAHADGFQSVYEMRDWFEREHGLPFTGIVIEWKPPI